MNKENEINKININQNHYYERSPHHVLFNLQRRFLEKKRQKANRPK